MERVRHFGKQDQRLLLQETFVLVTQTMIEGVQFTTSDANAQSTTSTTHEQHDKVKTSTRHEGKAQSWMETLIPKHKPTKIGAQFLQSIHGFLILAKNL